MYWQPLPDMWADRLILIVLVLAACFLIRRIFVRHVRKNSSISDYALILIAALPFLSGYMLTHGTLAHISFFDANMFTIHVLGGETMLLTAVFLFSSIRLDRNKCVGCAACEISCPTGTLTSFDENSVRVFDYSHYRCICCGACVRTCPEGAAGLRHDIGIGNFFRIVSKRNIGTSELSVCNGCRESYLPVVQLDKLEKMLPDETVHLCPACKTAAVTERLHRLDPRRMQPIGAVKPNLHPPSRPA